MSAVIHLRRGEARRLSRSAGGRQRSKKKEGTQGATSGQLPYVPSSAVAGRGGGEIVTTIYSREPTGRIERFELYEQLATTGRGQRVKPDFSGGRSGGPRMELRTAIKS